MTDLKALKEKLSVFDEYGVAMHLESKAEPHATPYFQAAQFYHQKDLATILKLIDIIEIQRDALTEPLLHGEYNKQEDYTEYTYSFILNEALTKTDKMLGELSNG